MQRRWKHLVSRVGALAGALALATSIGISAPAGANRLIAASPSPFCSTLMTFHPKPPKNSNNWTAYRAFAKSAIPTFERLAATAPNAGTKELMNQLVALLKFDASATSLSAYSTYWRTHLGHWEHDWQEFAAASLSCVKSLY